MVGKTVQAVDRLKGCFPSSVLSPSDVLQLTTFLSQTLLPYLCLVALDRPFFYEYIFFIFFFFIMFWGFYFFLNPVTPHLCHPEYPIARTNAFTSTEFFPAFFLPNQHYTVLL